MIKENWKWYCLRWICAFNLNATHFVDTQTSGCNNVKSSFHRIVFYSDIGQMGFHLNLHIYVWMSYCLCAFWAIYFVAVLCCWCCWRYMFQLFFFNLQSSESWKWSKQQKKISETRECGLFVSLQVYLKVSFIPKFISAVVFLSRFLCAFNGHSNIRVWIIY